MGLDRDDAARSWVEVNKMKVWRGRGCWMGLREGQKQQEKAVEWMDARGFFWMGLSREVEVTQPSPVMEGGKNLPNKVNLARRTSESDGQSSNK